MLDERPERFPGKGTAELAVMTLEALALTDRTHLMEDDLSRRSHSTGRDVFAARPWQKRLNKSVLMTAS